MQQEKIEDIQKSEELSAVDTCLQYHEILEFLGRKWMGAVLSLLATGPYRFNELLGNISGISDRMLTERLRDLEAYDFISRNVVTTSPIRVEYRLTEKGEQLHDVVNTLLHSSQQWFSR